MIRINLLPFRSTRKKENIRRQLSIFVLSLILAAVAIFAVNFLLGSQLDDLNSRIAATQTELTKYEKINKEIEEIKKKLDNLEWMELITREEHPLENRAIRGLYAPGSIFKLTMALGALEAGLITEQTSFFCAGAASFYGRPFHCWQRGGHGALSLTEAIRYSCNVYFYNLGRRMGIDRIADSAKRLGLGDKTGIDLPGEKEGLVPTPEWSRSARKTDWYLGETISVAIGQGPLVVTPLQVALHTAIIANTPMSHRRFDSAHA